MKSRSSSSSPPPERRGGLPPKPERIELAAPAAVREYRRWGWMALGFVLLAGAILSPQWPDAVDPTGARFPLAAEGQAALGLFALTVVWWVAEVVPIGVTSILIAVLQVLLAIRDPRAAFTDFMDPSVWFIFGSVVIGMAFSKTGLTDRMAYGMLAKVGERTDRILLGTFVLTAGLTHIMAHTAVAAAVFPLLAAIHGLYSESGAPTRFGKALFMGMAYVAGAGSIVTLLGAARGAVAIGFFKDIAGREVTFFEYTYFLAPVGWLMVLLLWVFFRVAMPPERRTIPGLRERVAALRRRLGPMSGAERTCLAVVAIAVGLLAMRSLVPVLGFLDKSAVILCTTVLFFALRILDLEDLERIPWNVILLFGGAMSIGFCLWQTGAARWLAVHWLMMFEGSPWLLFVMAIGTFVLIMTNVIMNVAAIAIVLPVALVMAGYLGVAPEVILFVSLAAAGMPFIFLVGAAPNAIAYDSGQFTAAEFARYGVAASLLLLLVLTAFVAVIWPAMGMPVLGAAG